MATIATVKKAGKIIKSERKCLQKKIEWEVTKNGGIQAIAGCKCKTEKIVDGDGLA